MQSPADIGRIGEKAIVDFMESNGYTNIVWDTKGPGSTDVEGVNPKGVIQLFQVKTAVLPEAPDSLTQDEKTAIKARAKNKGASAWQARVQLTSSHQLSRDIEFTQL